VHQEKHEKELVRFVQAQRDALSRMPTALLSVSLSEAGAEDLAATRDYRQGSSRDAARMIEHFCEQTGWRPGHAHAIAGALPYTRYNPLLRWVMKRIAGRAGASTDTSRDLVYTDWGALERVVDEIAEAVGPPPGSREIGAAAPQP
jgi:menaquinone-dependent protoporphyrinogen oxidase